MILPPRQQQPRHLGVERQLGQLVPERRELTLVVDGIQFLQQLVTIGNGARTRRLDKWKFFHLAESKCAHAQNDRCQRHAENFRIGKFGTLQEIRLVVEADAHAAHHATATSRALIGSGACDIFDAQLLHLLAHAVAVDTRLAAIDHIADVWYGKRSFRHVGRQYHAAHAGGGFEHAILFGNG